MATVKKKKISDLHFDNKNINKGSEFGTALLEKSIRETGLGRSVLVDKNNVLIAGNKTVEAEISKCCCNPLRKMTRNEKRRKLFIDLMIKATTPEQEVIAYKTAYPGCKSNHSAATSCGRLLHHVEIRDAIDKGRKERDDIIQKAAREELERIAKESIASTIQLRAILSQIALGKFKRKRVVAAIDPKSKKIIKGEVDESPTESDMISAADKLFKITGEYAPEKHVHDAGASFLEVMKGLAKKKNNGASDQ